MAIIEDTTCVSSGVITKPPKAFYVVISLLLANIHQPTEVASV